MSTVKELKEEAAKEGRRLMYTVWDSSEHTRTEPQDMTDVTEHDDKNVTQYGEKKANQGPYSGLWHLDDDANFEMRIKPKSLQ